MFSRAGRGEVAIGGVHHGQESESRRPWQTTSRADFAGRAHASGESEGRVSTPRQLRQIAKAASGGYGGDFSSRAGSNIRTRRGPETNADQYDSPSSPVSSHRRLTGEVARNSKSSTSEAQQFGAAGTPRGCHGAAGGVSKRIQPGGSLIGLTNSSSGKGAASSPRSASRGLRSSASARFDTTATGGHSSSQSPSRRERQTPRYAARVSVEKSLGHADEKHGERVSYAKIANSRDRVEHKRPSSAGYAGAAGGSSFRKAAAASHRFHQEPGMTRVGRARPGESIRSHKGSRHEDCPGEQSSFPLGRADRRSFASTRATGVDDDVPQAPTPRRSGTESCMKSVIRSGGIGCDAQHMPEHWKQEISQHWKQETSQHRAASSDSNRSSQSDGVSDADSLPLGAEWSSWGPGMYAR